MAKQDLHAIHEAESWKEAEPALDRFVAKQGAKSAKAVACLSKDRESPLAFSDFPAEHWQHVRTADELDKGLVRGGWSGGRVPERPPRVWRRHAPTWSRRWSSTRRSGSQNWPKPARRSGHGSARLPWHG